MELTSFESLFKKNYLNLVLYAYKILQNYGESEDIVQDVFLSYWKKRDQTIIDNLDSYLFAAVKRRCSNSIRHLKVVNKYQQQFLVQNAIYGNPYDQLVGNEIESVIKETLDNLPDKTRKIFIMNRFESKKYREIADELDISIKTVESHMGKVLKLLRLNLSHHIC